MEPTSFNVGDYYVSSFDSYSGEGFNGADVFQRRRHHRSSNPMIYNHCFNGADVFQRRRLPDLRRRDTSNKLQWSRRLSTSETHT